MEAGGVYAPICVYDDEVGITENFKFLVANIINNTFWSNHIDKKPQLRKYTNVTLPQKSKDIWHITNISTIYQCTIEIFLSPCFIAWYGYCSAQDHHKLQASPSCKLVSPHRHHFMLPPESSQHIQGPHIPWSFSLLLSLSLRQKIQTSAIIVYYSLKKVLWPFHSCKLKGLLSHKLPKKSCYFTNMCLVLLIMFWNVSTEPHLCCFLTMPLLLSLEPFEAPSFTIQLCPWYPTCCIRIQKYTSSFHMFMFSSKHYLLIAPIVKMSFDSSHCHWVTLLTS